MTEQTTLVTGASAGIGRGIAERLLRRGHHIINLSRRPAAEAHERLHDFPVDLADTDATREVMAEISSRFEVSSLVHNAGVIRPALLEEVGLDDVDYLNRLHVEAPIVMLQSVLDSMKAARFGRVVLISSRAALGLQTRTAYTATKAAQIGLVRTWALELGQHGITVNAIAPGPVVTDMFTEVVPEDSEQANRIAEGLPVRRLGRPADVAAAVEFFLSPDAGFVTGQCLYVCGGASVGSFSL